MLLIPVSLFNSLKATIFLIIQFLEHASFSTRNHYQQQKTPNNGKKVARKRLTLEEKGFHMRTQPLVPVHHHPSWQRKAMLSCTQLIKKPHYIFRELFRMAEEEFGLPSDLPITIPCEAVFMDYLISLIQRRVTTEIEKAFLMSISSCRSSWLDHRDNSQLHQVVYCFWVDQEFVNTCHPEMLE